jgi:uncharacterized membrane protein YhaH (DUF805 family)
MKDTVSTIIGERTATTSSAGPKNVAMMLAALAAVAVVVSMAAFALRQVSLGVGAASVALLAIGASLSWLSADARRLRDAQRIAR